MATNLHRSIAAVKCQIDQGWHEACLLQRLLICSLHIFCSLGVLHSTCPFRTPQHLRAPCCKLGDQWQQHGDVGSIFARSLGAGLANMVQPMLQAWLWSGIAKTLHRAWGAAFTFEPL